MIAELKPYPACKDSGVPWLGEVPAHWEVERLKSSMTNVIEPTATRQGADLYIALEHVESWTGRLRQVSSEVLFDSQVKRFRSGDVLFGKLRPYLAKVTRPTSDGVCVGEFLVLRPRASYIQSPYIEQLLRSKPIIDAVNSATFGAKMPRADWQFVGGMALTLPPLPEQAAIVRLLDHIDRRIRRYVSAKQKLIKMLEEQKQAIIHRAVTRGLDPGVRLKPSGVEWLGDIPEHWDVRRLRYLIQGKLTYGANAAAEFVNPAWPRYLRITDFGTNGKLQSETFRSLPPEIAKDYLVQPGDILLARSGATVGKSFLVTTGVGTACHAGYLIRARPRRSIIQPEFLFAFTQSAGFARWKDSTFIIATIQNIGADRYADLPVPIPPIPEQTAILRFLQMTMGWILAATERTQSEISLLREYRTRLIADVVTGKVDVRDIAARLPDEAEEPEPLDEATVLSDILEETEEGEEIEE